MPMREYECIECGEDLERYEPYIKKLETPPRCSYGKKMKRMFSAPQLVMYGDGCYESSGWGSQWRNHWGKDFRRKNEGKGAVDSAQKAIVNHKTDSLGKEYSKYPDIIKEG